VTRAQAHSYAVPWGTSPLTAATQRCQGVRSAIQKYGAEYTVRLATVDRCSLPPPCQLPAHWSGVDLRLARTACRATLEALGSLRVELKARQSDLVFRMGEPEDVLPGLLHELPPSCKVRTTVMPWLANGKAQV
jgi:hypothetical protein